MGSRRILISLMVLAVLFGAALGQSEEPQSAAGTLTVELINLDSEKGEMKGQGMLRFAGKEYPCRIAGLSAKYVSFLTIAVVGNVYNLKQASDLTGTYTPFQTSEILGGSRLAEANVLMVQNRHDVLIYLYPQEGAQLKVDPQGLTIEMP